MNGDFPAKDTVYTPYIPINVWFWPTLCICGLTLHTGCAVCYLLKVGTMNHVYIWHGVYMAILAGKSPNEWSIMVYIYRSGQPCTCFTCSIVTHVKNASKWRSRKAVHDGACQKTKDTYKWRSRKAVLDGACQKAKDTYKWRSRKAVHNGACQ